MCSDSIVQRRKPEPATVLLRWIILGGLFSMVLAGCGGGDAPGTGDATPEPPGGMVFIPGGVFWFGSTENEIDMAWRMSSNFVGRLIDSRRVWYEDEVYRLTRVRPFYIDRFEVAVGEYKRFLDAGGGSGLPSGNSNPTGGNDLPVVGVTQYEAGDYAAWAGKRLPTAEEWEWAARGAERRLFPWGNGLPDGTRGNYADRSTSLPWRDLEFDDGNPGLAPGGCYPAGATPEGVCDMGGNAREWTASAGMAVVDPRDGRIYPWNFRRAVPGWEKLAPVAMYYIRGGSWDSAADDLRCSDVRMLPPETKMISLGFRCVMDAPGCSKSGRERTGDGRQG